MSDFSIMVVVVELLNAVLVFVLFETYEFELLKCYATCCNVSYGYDYKYAQVFYFRLPILRKI
jgi:hypothetical protein